MIKDSCTFLPFRSNRGAAGPLNASPNRFGGYMKVRLLVGAVTLAFAAAVVSCSDATSSIPPADAIIVSPHGADKV